MTRVSLLVGCEAMYKSILAISEGGPDAVWSFRLAATMASMFDASVDAVHFSEAHRGDFDIVTQSLPFLKTISDGRVTARARESERAFTGDEEVTLDRVVSMGRSANILLVGRPGSDPDNISPETVRAALYDCARPVVIAPPHAPDRPIASVVVAWNGSAQAARAVGAALPFLEKADRVTIVVGGTAPDDVATPLLLRTLGRRGVSATVATLETGAASGRARGRALRDFAKESKADLLVMGGYGHGQLTNLLGLGGATAKVIASCPMPLLLAH
jgi:nucleotide-binding universal stress UspA family protein